MLVYGDKNEQRYSDRKRKILGYIRLVEIITVYEEQPLCDVQLFMFYFLIRLCTCIFQ